MLFRSNSYLHIIRTGAIEIRDQEDVLHSRRGEGDTFGARSILRGSTLYNIKAIEDSLLYLLPKSKFTQLCQHYKPFAYFFNADVAERLHMANQPQPKSGGSDSLMTLQIKELINPNWISLPVETPINEAARKMTDERASAILVCNDNNLNGIITDHDMTSRCVAANMDINAPINEIMTRDPVTIEEDEFAYAALMMMSRHNIRHLPVMRQNSVVGIVSASDLIQHQSASPVFLVSDINKKTSVEQLADVSGMIPQVLVSLVEASADANSIGRMISILGESITVCLLKLAEEKLGPPPVPYCWLAFGSLARQEQAAHSDQDNGLLIADDYDPDLHADYFDKLAKFVNDGLDACGYEYCPGDVMASNPKWRQSLHVWKNYFSDWISKPEPMALMHASIFFDMRCLYGDARLVNELQQYVLKQSSANRIFLAHLAGNALHFTPPLGFFRRFVLVHNGKHNNTLDLKHNGLVPIIDLARIYSLASGVDVVNTLARLEASGGKGEVSQQGARDLTDAFEFIAITRLQHQAAMIKAGKPANNYVAPDELSNFERKHLKDAFEIVRTMQSALGQRFQSGRF